MDDVDKQVHAGVEALGLTADGRAGHSHDGHDGHDGYCTEALHELYTFLDGELTDAKRAQIQHHLDDCSPCLEVYDFEAELRQVIRHRCRDEVPEALRAQVAYKLSLSHGEWQRDSGQAQPSSEADASS
jgi:mycothiol system anti-sigma-R factor